MERARAMIQALTQEPEIGATYDAVVKSTTPFGAFVEILPGTEGLVHISELQHGRTEKTEDVVKKGDRVRVKLIDRDERGRLRLSMKALLPKPEGAPAEENGEGRRGDRERGERGERGGRPRGGERERAAAGATAEDGAEAPEDAPAEEGEGGRSRSRRGGGRSRR
jgi:polyribonucleotide nucleotidyltransferase